MAHSGNAGPAEQAGQLRRTLGAMADWRSRGRLLAMKAGVRLRPDPERLVAFRIRELGGAEFWVRPGTTDVGTIFHDFVEGEHLPPPPVRDEDLRRVVELGSNVGAGVAGLAARYRNARVLAVEPDPENAAICRRNLKPYGDRCRLAEVAIWDSETDLAIEGDEPSGYTVREARTDDPAGRRVRATTIDSLLDREFGGDQVDYMILNLEGTEPRVLAAGAGWAPRVRSIRCEIHPHHGFAADDCERLLRDLGYDAWTEPEPWGGWGFGVRR